MSIFTRLYLFIALAFIAIASFIVFTANQISEQDKLTLDYRELARKENAISRIHANTLEKRVAALIYRKTSDKEALDQLTQREKIIHEQIALARELNAASSTTLDSIENLEAQYDAALTGYRQALDQIQAIATLSLKQHKHKHLPNIDHLVEDLQRSFTTLSRFPSSNSPVKALQSELDIIITKADTTERTYIAQYQTAITDIQKQHAISQQHIQTMDSIGPKVSTLIEDVKLALLDQQNTLGPKLTESVNSVAASISWAAGGIFFFLLVLIWATRVYYLRPLRKALNSLRSNQTQLDTDNLALRDMLHSDDSAAAAAAAAAQKPETKRNEIQQLEHIASETKQALVHSKDLQERYLEQREELAEFQKRQAVDNLVAGFSHNMGNFLQPIISLAALLKKQESDTEKKQFISIIFDSASKAQDTLNKVLTFSRTQQSEAHATHQTLSHAINLVSASAKKIETIIDQTVSFDQPLRIGARDLNTLVLNLINNSLDSRDDSVPITIRITGEKTAEHYSLSIIDDGSGMDNATLERALDKFFTTKPVGQGTGLGLNEARELVETAGGRLTITSSLGEGTTVNVTLPFTDEPMDQQHG